MNSAVVCLLSLTWSQLPLPSAATTVVTAAQSDGEAKAEAAERARLRALLDKAPALLDVFPDSSASAALSSIPVHRWTNDERDPHGEGLFVLWSHRGRPVAGASIYPWNGRLIHDLESLSRQPLLARRDGATAWKPERGLSFAVIPGAEAPADAAAARLRQMKALADTFAVTMIGWRADNSDREELRRLPKEFFRYKPQDAALIDGALFAFVKGTDPETLLLIEAVKNSAGERYEYSFVRCTSGGLEARHQGRVVWTAQKHGARKDPAQLSFSSAVMLEDAYLRVGVKPNVPGRNTKEN